jgi:hypothetical protein
MAVEAVIEKKVPTVTAFIVESRNDRTLTDRVLRIRLA